MRIRNLHSRCDKKKFEFARKLRENPTHAEAVLWDALRTKQVKGVKFRRQHVLFGWIADFWCSSLQMVIEVDGGSHVKKGEADAMRDAVLAAYGLLTVRFTNQEVLHALPRVIEYLKRTIDARRDSLSTLRPVTSLLPNRTAIERYTLARRPMQAREAIWLAARLEQKPRRWIVNGPRHSSGLAVCSGALW